MKGKTISRERLQISTKFLTNLLDGKQPEEAIAGFESPYVKFIQMPYSIFDYRMKDQIPPFFQKAKPIIKRVNEICNENHVSRVELAFVYVKREKNISHLVFGVENMEQLKENMKLFQHDLPEDLVAEMDQEFQNIEADIVMPSLWKR